MSEIQKRIREALERYEKADEDEEISRAKYIIELECVDWLTHQQTIIDQQAEEIERLRQALVRERDDALTWDGIGTVKRINKVLEENPHVNT